MNSINIAKILPPPTLLDQALTTNKSIPARLNLLKDSPIDRFLYEEEQKKYDDILGSVDYLENGCEERKRISGWKYQIYNKEMYEWRNKKKYKNRGIYKERAYMGMAFGKPVVDVIIYVLSTFRHLYGDGNIRPSLKTLADNCKISVRTLITYLKELKKEGIINWKSGKKTWETNSFELLFPDTKVIERPIGFEFLPKLWFTIKTFLINKSESKRYKEKIEKIYQHISLDFAHHILRIRLYIRTYLQKYRNSEQIPNKSRDGPRKPSRNHESLRVLGQVKISQRDRFVLSNSFSEFCIRQSIDDMNWYLGQPDKQIQNIAAFLTSRCKYHRKMSTIKDEKEFTLSWLKDYMKSIGDKVVFVNNLDQYPLNSTEKRPIIDLKIHREDEKKSIMKILQKVNGNWITKRYNFSRPNLYESIKNDLENRLRNLREVSI